MSFEAPGLLWLSVVLPGLVGLGFVFWTRRRRRAARAFGSAALLERLGAGDLSAFPVRRLILVCAGAAFLGLAAAGPRWGLETVEEGGLSGDIVLTLDVSRSMLARDVAPDRMERQRVLGRRIVRDLAGDRFGLVAFAGRAYALTPLTGDHSAIHLFLDALDPDIVSQGGSTLSAAIRQATDLARGPHDAGTGTVVLVSDGEALEDRDAVLRSAHRAGRLGITIHTVGIGTTQGAPIPARPMADGQSPGHVRGPDGEIVVSRLDDELLRDVARLAGGRYYGLGEPGATDALIRALRGLDRTEGEARRGVRERPRYAWFVVGALSLLALDGLLLGAGALRRSGRPVQEVGGEVGGKEVARV